MDPHNPDSPPDLAATPSTPLAVTVGASSSSSSSIVPQSPSRYESQKRRDWNTFNQYLRNHRPPLSLAQCSGAHVLEFLRYLDQFGKTKVHAHMCPFYGHPNPPAPCPCPLRQAWGSLDALVGRLRAAFEENGGHPEANPFGARAVRLYLREVRDSQAKARGIAYEKKKRKKPPTKSPTAAAAITSDATITDHHMGMVGGGGGGNGNGNDHGNLMMGGGQFGNFMVGVGGEEDEQQQQQQQVVMAVNGRFIPLSVFN